MISPIRAFSIREKNTREARKIRAYLLDYKHVENMMTLLVDDVYQSIRQHPKDKRDWTLLNNLFSSVVMKGVLTNNQGGEQTRDAIATVNHQLGEHHLLIELKKAYERLNDKMLSMVLRQVVTQWQNYFENRKAYWQGDTRFTGEPQKPKPKGLKKVHHWALPIEESKWSVKRKNKLGLTLGKKQRQIPLVFNGYLGEHKPYLTGLTLKMSNGEIYYQFSHKQPRFEFEKTNDKKAQSRPVKYAGLDIGVQNLGSLFIDDATTPSLVYQNNESIHYNVRFNKEVAKLNKQISQEVKTTKMVDNCEVPDTYTIAGKALQKKKSKLFEQRNRYFDTLFDQLAKRFCEYCWCSGVTDLALSKNLTFVKSTGEIKQQKKSKQTFYQMPFGRLLRQIEEKALDYGIRITWVNEAYSSKTSCLSANTSNNQRRRKANLAITSNDTNGYRGGKRKKLGRGLFKDTLLNKVFHSDVGGAANHIQIAFENSIDFSYLQTHLFKLANPITIKSATEFDALNRQIGIAG